MGEHAIVCLSVVQPVLLRMGLYLGNFRSQGGQGLIKCCLRIMAAQLMRPDGIWNASSNTTGKIGFV